MHFDGFVAEMEDGSIDHPLQRSGRRHGYFTNAWERNRIPFTPFTNHKGCGNQQCEREMECKFRADAPNRFDIDVPVHTLNDPLDHIHTHASTSLITDLLDSGEAGHEDELDGLRFRQSLGDVCADQSPLNRFGTNLPD